MIFKIHETRYYDALLFRKVLGKKTVNTQRKLRLFLPTVTNSRDNAQN